MPIESASSRCPAAFSRSSWPRSSANQWRWRAGSEFRRRQAHQAAQAKPRQGRDRVGERGQSRGCDAGLRRLVAELDLDADGKCRQRVRPLVGETLGDPQPVERVHPVKERCRLTRLVGLQRADEVAAEGTAGERPEMCTRFLQVVLAEVGKARVK